MEYTTSSGTVYNSTIIYGRGELPDEYMCSALDAVAFWGVTMTMNCNSNGQCINFTQWTFSDISTKFQENKIITLI